MRAETAKRRVSAPPPIIRAKRFALVLFYFIVDEGLILVRDAFFSTGSARRTSRAVPKIRAVLSLGYILALLKISVLQAFSIVPS
jgi:hypothetical protein